MAFREPFAEFGAGLMLFKLVEALQAECDNRVTSASMTTRGKVNQPLSYSVSSHVASGSCLAGCGIAYIDGPADSIKVTIDGAEFDVPKGYIAVIHRSSPVGSCTSISASGTASFPVAGNYAIRLAAGYVSGNIFQATDYRSYTVVIEEAPPPTPTPPTTEIPTWLWILIGVAAGAAIAAAIAVATKK